MYEILWVQYRPLINSENRLTQIKGGCTWLASGLLVYLRAGLVARSLVCWLKQNKRHRREGSRGPEQGRLPRFPSAAMVACLSSLSSTGTALQASIFEAKGMVRERRARGFNLGASRRGLLLKKEGATSGHGWRPASSWGALLGQREG